MKEFIIDSLHISILAHYFETFHTFYKVKITFSFYLEVFRFILKIVSVMLTKLISKYSYIMKTFLVQLLATFLIIILRAARLLSEFFEVIAFVSRMVWSSS